MNAGRVGTGVGVWIGIAAALLLALAGALGEWIGFPLSAPIQGLDWDSADPAWLRRYPAAPFLLLLTAAPGALLLNGRRIGTWLLAVSGAALLAVPAGILLFDPTWLYRSVEDSSQFDALYYFANTFLDVPNADYAPQLRHADAFQYLPDRAWIAGALLAWGWGLCLLAWVAVVLLLRRARLLPSLKGLVPPLALAGLAALVAGAPALMADFRYRQADQRLALGDYRGALASYTAALDHDPVLGYSKVFLINAARTYYQKDGSTSPFVGVWLADSQRTLGFETRKAGLTAAAAAADDSPLGLALGRLARRQTAELWVAQGLAYLKRGDPGAAAFGFRKALNEYRDWRHARWFFARALLDLKNFDESEQLLDELATTVHNPSVRANVYNALGDAAAGAGEQAKARKAYATAYSLDSKENLWAMKGLSGS